LRTTVIIVAASIVSRPISCQYRTRLNCNYTAYSLIKFNSNQLTVTSILYQYHCFTG